MKNRGRLLLTLLSAAVLAVVLPLATASGKSGTATASKVKVEFVGADIGDPFYIAMKCGAFDAAKKYSVALTWGGITGVDFAPELTAFNAAVQRHPQGIITAPFSATAFIQPVKKAMDSGIPVVTVDGSLAKPVELQNLRTDNFKAGGIGAVGMAKALGGKGKVAIVSFTPSVPVPKARVDGFKAKIKASYPGIKVVSVQYGGADAAKAAHATAALLQRFPDLAGLYATDSSDADGAGSAILAAGKRGKIKLVAFDAGPPLVAGLKKGLYDGLVAQAPYDEGFNSVKVISQYIRGQLKKSQIPNQAWTGAFYVDLKNLNTPQAQKYIYKASCK
jgi:ribose transport system substrate-binding protein